MAFIPRGIRLNNPGNIRHGDLWRGMAPGQDDPAFVAFSAPAYGIRALAKLLLNYQRRHALRSVEAIVARYAPPSENDTRAYVRSVAAACGVAGNESIDVAAYLPRLVPAIIKHENGVQPYGGDVIAEGIRMALEE